MSFKVLAIIIFLFSGFFAFVSTNKTVGPKEKSGNYVSVLKRFRECEKPLRPYAKDPIGVLRHEIKNNLFKANLTVFRKNKNVQISIQEFYYEDGHWQLSFNARNITCRYKWIAILMDLIGITYDKKNCGVPKGSYTFEMDINTIDHAWMPTREYGRMLRHVEVQSKEGTIVCFEMENDVVPTK